MLLMKETNLFRIWIDSPLHTLLCAQKTWNSGSSCSSCSCNAYQKGCVGPDETGATCNEQLEDDVTNPQHQKYNIGPQCCPGWNGTLCDLCSTVEVCPRIASNASSSINGTLAAHTCTSGSIVPYSVSPIAFLRSSGMGRADREE